MFVYPISPLFTAEGLVAFWPLTQDSQGENLVPGGTDLQLHGVDFSGDAGIKIARVIMMMITTITSIMMIMMMMMMMMMMMIVIMRLAMMTMMMMIMIRIRRKRARKGWRIAVNIMMAIMSEVTGIMLEMIVCLFVCLMTPTFSKDIWCHV